MIKLKPFSTTHPVYHLLLVFPRRRDFYWIQLVVSALPVKTKDFSFIRNKSKHHTQLLPFLFRSNIYICMMFDHSLNFAQSETSWWINTEWTQRGRAKSKEKWVLVKLCVDKSFIFLLYSFVTQNKAFFICLIFCSFGKIRWRHNTHTHEFMIWIFWSHSKGYGWKLCWGQIWMKMKTTKGS